MISAGTTLDSGPGNRGMVTFRRLLAPGLDSISLFPGHNTGLFGLEERFTQAFSQSFGTSSNAFRANWLMRTLLNS